MTLRATSMRLSLSTTFSDFQHESEMLALKVLPNI